MEAAELDVTTLLVGLAVIVFAYSLAQLVIMITQAIMKRVARRRNAATDRNQNGFHDRDDLLS